MRWSFAFLQHRKKSRERERKEQFKLCDIDIRWTHLIFQKKMKKDRFAAAFELLMMREKTKRLLFRKSKMQIVAKTSKKLKSQFRQELFKGQRAEDKRYFGQTSLRSSRWLLRSEKSRSDENWEEIKLLLMIVFLSESPWKSNEKEIIRSVHVFWKICFLLWLEKNVKTKITL